MTCRLIDFHKKIGRLGRFGVMIMAMAMVSLMPFMESALAAPPLSAAGKNVLKKRGSKFLTKAGRETLTKGARTAGKMALGAGVVAGIGAGMYALGKKHGKDDEKNNQQKIKNEKNNTLQGTNQSIQKIEAFLAANEHKLESIDQDIKNKEEQIAQHTETMKTSQDDNQKKQLIEEKLSLHKEIKEHKMLKLRILKAKKLLAERQKKLEELKAGQMDEEF